MDNPRIMCQMLYSNILNVMGSEFSDTHSVLIVRELFETEKCDSYTNLSPLRDSYRSFIKSREICDNNDKFIDRFIDHKSNKDYVSNKEIITQAYLHYYVWTKKLIGESLTSTK